MKSFMSKNKKLLAILIIGLFIFSSGVAFAYTSQDWVVKATAWANTNCVNPSGAGNQKAFFCYLWSKSAEQQTAIDSLNTANSTKTSQISTLDSRLTTLETNLAPLDFTFFNGVSPTGTSPTLDTKNYTKMTLTTNCPINALNYSFYLQASNDGENWATQSSFGSYQACNSNIAGFSKDVAIAGRYYRLVTDYTMVSITAIARLSK